MPGGSSYHVAYSQTVREQLKDLCLRAAHQGRGAEVLAAIKKIDEQLHTRPLQFGDPSYRSPSKKLTFYTKVFPPLVVHYAVQEEARAVFVKGFKPFPADAF